ncbi:uncharacterized protein C5orf34 homolog isoform X2 [Anneissia japonica]|uniref:uncharacterized protein C5orf34 homolog isoform X2 n=1 Tax=Anneissia japonica TaxID=1529436 RepID=UPI001425674B|nr:uncharacterized protein C5orf34 homolog isoform X2 [Anneissia japonica]
MDSMQLSPSCLLLYQDDSLVCSYADGTNLELSPCGSAFIHTQAHPSPGVHPLLNTRKGAIRQRTAFVTSEHKTKVQYAMDIRNRFAARPYVTSNLLHDTDYILETYADIKEVNWSPKLDEQHVDVLDNGGVRIRSLDECASLIISANEHDLSIEYLCKISNRVVDNRRENIRNTICEDSQRHCDRNHAGIFGSGATAVRNDSCATHDTVKQKTIQFAYVWMIQHLSVKHCPFEWQHPLQLVKKFKHMRVIGKKKNNNECPLQEENEIDTETNASIENCLGSSASVISDEDDDNEKERQMKHHFLENSFSANRNVPKTIPAAVVDCTFVNSVKMHLPDHLPTTCSNPQLHHWRNISSTQQLSENVDFDALVKTPNCPLKMMIANGVIYRFFLKPVKSAEIYPGDGSVITLQDSRGQYFTHTVVNKDGLTTDKMFKVNNQTLLSSNSPQAALIRMVNKAFRLLSVMPYSKNSSTEVCWKILEPPVQIEKKQLAVIIEETTVPGLGYFTAFLDGRIRIVFADRTILNMEADDHKVMRYLSDAHLPYEGRVRAPNKTCEIILPSGRKRNISTQNPTQEFSWYVNLALEWAEWLHTYQKSSPEFSEESHKDGHRYTLFS